MNLGKRKLPEADKSGGAAGGRKVVPVAKPQQGGVRDEARGRFAWWRDKPW